MKQVVDVVNEKWLSLDPIVALNRAIDAEGDLREYVRKHQTTISIAGNVGVGKSQTAKMLAHSLHITPSYELLDDTLSGLLNKFIFALESGVTKNIQATCYPLQVELREKRLRQRKHHSQGRYSFIEDRAPEEDNLIFHQRFLDLGYLSKVQYDKLLETAKVSYNNSPKSDVMICLQSSTQLARAGVVKRNRPGELEAWNYQELDERTKLYELFPTQVTSLNLHKGSILVFNRDKINPLDQIHRGYMCEKILKSIKEY